MPRTRAARGTRRHRYTPTFAELVGDETEFFARYLDARPLLRRDALVADPRELLLHEAGQHGCPLAARLTSGLGRDSAVRPSHTRSGRRGVPAGTEDADLFVIQVEGATRWTVWPTRPRPDTPDRPVIDTTLAPGDVLYVPSGTPHEARAPGGASFHLSVLVRPKTRVDPRTELTTPCRRPS